MAGHRHVKGYFTDEHGKVRPLTSALGRLEQYKTNVPKLQFEQLFDAQTRITEHQWNHDYGNGSYFIEAAGDAYRELSKGDAMHGAYVDEKLKRLEKFHISQFTSGDLREFDEFTASPAYKASQREFLRKAYELRAVTEDADFGHFEHRRAAMLKSCDAVIALTEWTIGERHMLSAQADVESLIEATRASLQHKVSKQATMYQYPGFKAEAEQLDFVSERLKVHAAVRKKQKQEVLR